jgi:DNA-damage-inducible protein D
MSEIALGIMSFMNKDLDISFDDFAQKNGTLWWWATDLMRMLGYDNWDKFEKVINQAIKTCMNLSNVRHYDEFKAERRQIGEEEVQDFKLTRYACMLTAMNGDGNIPQVAQAQNYFIETLQQLQIHLQEQDVQRVSVRHELSDGFKSLGSVFTKQGGIDYAAFNSAGIQGMYNNYANQLAKKRKVDPKKLYDSMGRYELAANLFRVTTTEAKIKKDSIKGQANLEKVHYETGKQVREIVKEATGKKPENLPQERQLPEVKKDLKISHKEMKKLDEN